MAKAKDHIIAKAPTSFEDIERFLNEMPYLTAKLHGKKYRFMYQVYSSPKYREQGKEFFKGVFTFFYFYQYKISQVAKTLILQNKIAI